MVEAILQHTFRINDEQTNTSAVSANACSSLQMEATLCVSGIGKTRSGVDLDLVYDAKRPWTLELPDAATKRDRGTSQGPFLSS